MGGDDRVYNKLEESIYRPLTYELSVPHLLKDDRKWKKKDSLFLYFSSLTADMLMFDCGCNFTWTSPAMSTFRSSDMNLNPLENPITAVQESWIAALINLGAAIGPLLFGKFADTFGRRKVLIMIAIFKIICYFILAFATHINLFYLARFLLGIGMGLSFAVMPMYTAEISDDHNRGKFISIMSVLTILGTQFSLIVGPLLSLKIFTLSCAAILLVPLIGLLLFVPETPIYLVSVGNRAAAKRTIKKLKNVNSEFAEMDLLHLTKTYEDEKSKESRFIDLFKTLSLRRAVIICLSLCSLQHLAGIFPIMAFIGPIFEITGSKIPADLSVILVSVVQLLATVLSSVAIEKLGRRFLLLLSMTGTCLSLLSLGIYFYLKESQSQFLPNIFWLPVTCLMAYMIFYNIGLTSVPMTILSEVFPSNIRSIATSFVTFFGAFTGFVVTFIFPIVMLHLGGANCFWLFSGFTALGIIFVSFVVPETKGKSFSEIQDILSTDKS